MYILGLFILLIFLFILLGAAADVALKYIRIIGQRLRITVFTLGLILGALTSLPELFIGINTVFRDVTSIAFGNLMGGSFVLLGLVAGIHIVANHGVSTDHLFKPTWFVIIGSFIFLPMFLALDGQLNSTDGLILGVVYIFIINGLLNSNSKNTREQTVDEFTSDVTTKKAIVYSFLGILGVVIVSRFIVDAALDLIGILKIPKLFAGLVVFSIGTNLPELTVVFTAWRKRVKRLGLGNIIGSAFTNSLIIGVLALMRPLQSPNSYFFWIFFALFAVVVVLYVMFALSGRKFSRKEGVVLLAVYVLFLLSQFSCLMFPEFISCQV